MDIVNAVKESQTEHIIEWAKETNCTDDEKFVEANGAPTHLIANTLEVSVLKARQLLNKAHEDGLVCKSKNNAGRYCCWWPVGYLQEIKSAI